MTNKVVWAEMHRARLAIAALYPSLFNLDAPVPLKIGIADDFVEKFPDMPARTRKALLYWLTTRRAYSAACVEGAPRYGFDGPCGHVDEKGARQAAQRFLNRDAAAKDKWPKPSVSGLPPVEGHTNP